MSDFYEQEICDSLGRSFNVLHKMIEDQDKKLKKIGKALIEEGKTKEYRIDKALEIIKNEL